MKLPVADPHDPRYTARGALYVPAGHGRRIWAASDLDRQGEGVPDRVRVSEFSR